MKGLKSDEKTEEWRWMKWAMTMMVVADGIESRLDGVLFTSRLKNVVRVRVVTVLPFSFTSENKWEADWR
jgi:hypothetical protein